MCIYMYSAKIMVIEIARHFNFDRSLRLITFFRKFFSIFKLSLFLFFCGDITSLKRFEDVFFFFVNFCVGIRISFEVL